MRKLKQAVSAFLCAAMLLTTNGITTLAAPTEVTESTEIQTEVPESTEEQIAMPDMEELSATEEAFETETEDTDEPQQKADNQTVQSSMLLSYLVFGSSYVEAPGQQYALVGIGDGTYELEQAVLHYQNQTTGELYTIEADMLDADAALFYIDFPDNSYAGIYEVISVDYTAAGMSGTIAISDTGIDAVFGVNTAVETTPDAVAVDAVAQEDVASTLITDAEGNVLSEADLGEVIANANSQVDGAGAVRATGAGEIVVVLDPGHGGNEPGAVRTINGITYAERDLVLKIANYCKAELETYTGVKVYMTRTDNTSAVESRSQRVQKAQQWGADILVSFHLNATGANMDSANGAAVYIPNAGYNSAYPYNTVGKGLGDKILEQLKKLGLANNGTKLDEDSNRTYADGSVADKLGINYWSKYYQYPFAGILIEHAFINNYNDVVYYLSSEEKLKKLGVADATGIAGYYGLQKKNALEIPELGTIVPDGDGALKLTWSAVKKAAGYQIYRAESEQGKYKKIATLTGAETVTYTDTALTNGKTYYYKVCAYTSKLTGNYSPVMAAYPLGTGNIISVKSNGSKTLAISWEAVAGAQKYQLYRSTSVDGTYSKVKELAGTLTDYQDTSVVNGTTYYYKVRAKASQNGKTSYGTFSEAFEGFSIATAGIRSVKSQENGTLLVSWKAVKNTYRYQVYRSTAENGTYKKIATVKTTSYEDASAEGDKIYYYKIRTVNRVNGVNGYGSYSAAKQGRLVGGTKISKIQTTASTKLKITWKRAEDAEGYKLYRSTAKNGTYRLIKTISNGRTTSYTNSKLTPGKTYYYKIQVIGASDGAGVMSAAMAGKTVDKTKVSYVQSASSTKLKVVWKKISGATGYRITRSTSKNGIYKEIKTITSGDTTSYTDSTVKAGKLYYYKISVQNKNKNTIGYSEYCEPLGGRTIKAPELSVPKSVSGAKIRISWSAVSRATGYQIYRSTTENGGYSRIATITSGKTVVYDDAPPKANTTYYYKVRSVNKNNGKTGYSEFSAPVSGKSLAVPKLSNIIKNADGSLKISWNKISGATKYRIYRRVGSSGKYTKLAEVKSSIRIYNDTDVISGTTYYYKVIAYNSVNGITGTSGSSAVKSYEIKFYEIMGTPGATEAQMVSYYKQGLTARQSLSPSAGYHYPAEVYSAKGAPDIETFVHIMYEEAVAEGVRPEVAFAQTCTETNFLQFTGVVRVEQCNFAGIGAIGKGVPGNTFADVRTGIRAQIQHLKAYASTEDLVNTCVDPRFIYVKRGYCEYVEWLGIQENPNTVWKADGKIESGCGWATAKNYGYILMTGINKILRL